MKYWKVYSNAARNPHPIKDVTYNYERVLDEAISYQFEECLNGGGVYYDLSDEARKLIDADVDDDDDFFEKRWEKIASEIEKHFEEEGILPAGDWGIIRTADDVGMFEIVRPNNW